MSLDFSEGVAVFGSAYRIIVFHLQLHNNIETGALRW